MLLLPKFLFRCQGQIRATTRLSTFMFTQQSPLPPEDSKEKGSTPAVSQKKKQKKKGKNEKDADQKENKIYLTVLMNAKPDKINDFLGVFQKLAEQTRKEAGCIRYELCQNVDAPTEMILWEIWKSQNDFTSHATTPHFKELIPQLDQFREGQSVQKKGYKVV